MKKKSGSGKRTLTIVLVVIMGLTVVMGLGGLSRMPVSARLLP